MKNKDCAYRKSTDWAFILFGIAMTAANVIMWLHFVGVIN